MDKVVDIKTAISHVKDGDRIMCGGFGTAGSPLNLIYALAEKGDVKHLHTISEDFGHGRVSWDQGLYSLVAKGMVDEITCAFFGHDKALRHIEKGEIKLNLFPMGTFVEKIRAAGAGLGGILTPTGVGTVVEEGKQVMEIDGKKYILELPLKANVAFIRAYKADRMGNCQFAYIQSNFNVAMGTAADIVIVEAENVVENGEIAPDCVQLPGVFVDYVVDVKGGYDL